VRAKKGDLRKSRPKPKHARESDRTSCEEFFVGVVFGAIEVKESKFTLVKEPLQYQI
jgi:hypothetical protein